MLDPYLSKVFRIVDLHCISEITFRLSYIRKFNRGIVELVYPGANFINIFSHKSDLRSFPLVTFWLWQKDFGKKALCTKNIEEIVHRLQSILLDKDRLQVGFDNLDKTWL
jgi:hypothetical protein